MLNFDKLSSYKQRRLLEGGCLNCSKNKPEPGLKSCRDCLNVRKAWRDRNRAAGVCLRCAKNKANPDKLNCQDCLDRSNSQAKKYRIERKIKAINLLGGKCACCQESRHHFLTFDHINKDGAKHRKEMILTGPTHGEGLAKRILEEPEIRAKFQILCWNCNCASFYYKSCPHKEIS